MSLSRRTFLAGAASGLSVLVLAACGSPEPAPTPPRTPTPEPTTDLPRPSAFARSAWGVDQFARGASSFVAVGAALEQRETLAASVDDRLFFAGEATSTDQPGTVAGAFESGRRVAAEIESAVSGPERVVVVGAGAAGAAAARRLADAGHEVTVVEARERVGGRIWTVEGDEWPVPVELGAAWIRGTDTDGLRARLLLLDVETAEVDTPVREVGADGAEVAPSDDAARLVADAVARGAEGQVDVSLAAALDAVGAADLSAEGAPSAADRLSAYLRTRVGLESGATADELSAWYAALPESPPFDGELVTGGLRRLVEDELDGLDVWLSTAVTAISHGDQGVSIRLSTGESVSADRALVTVPLGILKDEGIEFAPALPFAKRSAIAELGVGALETVSLAFPEQLWDTDAVVWSVVGSELPIADWINLQPLTGEPVLLGMVGGEAAAAFAALDDEAALRAALESLAPFLSDAAA